MVVIDADRGTGEIVLGGSVLGVDVGNERLRMSTDTNAGDRCVDAQNADIFLVDDSGGSLETTRGSLADLEPGQKLAVFGTESGSGCLAASTILAELEPN